MPPKQKVCNKGVRAHGTEKQQQTILEPYKHVKQYKKLKIVNDNVSTKLKQILENNCWNLKNLFQIELPDFLNDICNDGAVAWNNGIQYLDYKKNTTIKTNDISLEKLKNGEYKTLYRDKRSKGNKNTTEYSYALRIEFFTRTFDDFKQYENNDNLKWIVTHNRLLLYNILKYHNENTNTIFTINRDMKALTRVMKLLLGEEDELRYKFSVLQTAFTDLEHLTDDHNKISTEREIRTFVPYEHLFELCDKKEKEYFEKVNEFKRRNNEPEYNTVQEMYEHNSENGDLHSSEMFHLHQISLAIAINIWNYPSRTENFTMYFTENPDTIEKGENYVHFTDDNKCMMIYNDDKKCHKPVSYYLNSAALLGLNTRLCNMLKYSYKTYKRSSMFLQKNEWRRNKKAISSAAIGKWLSELMPNKNIGVNTFRSSFVSYYFPKWNNRQRNVMAIRMRTSMSQIMRSYLKFYTDPDTLVKIKEEPEEELVARVAQGNSENNRHVVNDNINNDIGDEMEENANINEEIIFQQPENAQVINQVADYHERRKQSFRKWYENDENKQKHRNRTKAAYGARYVRELNKGVIDFSKMNEETIVKYGIKKDDNGMYFI